MKWQSKSNPVYLLNNLTSRDTPSPSVATCEHKIKHEQRERSANTFEGYI
jgi:hypothetical protein